MESPVVLDKPPEYHGNDRGFPFEEEEGSGAWSELAARHPDIAARLRQRPATATWARKRRPSSQDATDDFGENFGSFDRFPFDDIPPEFREHFPSHFNRRFSSRDEPPPQPQASPPAQQPQQQTTATQTEQPQATDSQHQNPLPQYGLRNTVDLGQKSAVDPSVDADERNHRSMSAPPDQRPLSPKMSASHSHTEQSQMPSQPEPSNVRHIPIFVEGRDEPVINKADHKQYNEPKQTFTPPQQPHIDREQYFADDPASFHHPPNFSRAFGTPFNKGFRQGPQPFVQQKVYPQSAFTRGASPQRSQSPKQPHDEHYVKVPVHHENTAPKTETPSKSQPKQTPPQPKQTPPQPKQTTPQQPPPPQREQTPPQPPKPSANDPITQILSIQTDVLNLMTEVENFTGSKKDKRYMFLDEMLTRNLIKLDNIETDGKENIRMARKEAIRCIQKCIAVLEAKAEKGSSMTQPQDVEMKENAEAPAANEASAAVENGEVEMKEEKETEPQVEQAASQEMKDETQPQTETQPEEIPKTQENQNPEAAPTTDTVQETTPAEAVKPEEQNKDVEKQSSPTKKVVKKRDKSKDKAAVATVAKETNDKSNKAEETPALDSDKLEVMQIDTKGDKEQVMEVDGAASQ